MKSEQAKLITRIRWRYVLTDLVSTNVAMVLFNLFRLEFFHEQQSLVEYYLYYPKIIGGQIFFPLMMMFFYWLSGYYNKPEVRSRAQEALTTAGSATFGAVFIFFLAVVNDLYFRRRVALEAIFAAFVCIFVCVYIGRYIVTTITKRERRSRDIIPKGIMIGTDDNAKRIALRINQAASIESFEIIDFFDIADCAKILDYCRANNISHIVLAPTVKPYGRNLADLMRVAADIDGAIYITPEVNNLAVASRRAFNVVGEPLVCISSPNISESNKNVKRLCDVVLASLALIILSPAFVYIAYRIKRDSPGSIFFRQERLGRGGKPFNIIKFRSMFANAEGDGKARVTIDNDPRITPFGHTMRKYRLDELPQFWNVLLGEMSIVGPRPERQAFAEQISARVPLYPLIYQVRPGITSWGMVRYGYASNVDQMIERLRYDLIYLENISIITDIKILLHTVATVFSGKGK